MDNLKNFSAIVKHLLETDPRTRNSDNFLYYRVCCKLNAEAVSMPFSFVILNLEQYKFPQFETIRRTRQKMQHDHPELAAAEVVQEGRSEREKVFREYARRL